MPLFGYGQTDNYPLLRLQNLQHDRVFIPILGIFEPKIRIKFREKVYFFATAFPGDTRHFFYRKTAYISSKKYRFPLPFFSYFKNSKK